MLANFLNKTKPINFILLLGLFVFGFFHASFSTTLANGFSLENLLNSCFYLLLFLTIFFFFNFIVSKNNLTYDNSYAFFAFTILLACILPELLNTKVLVLILLHFLFLRKIYSFHSSKKLLQKLFDSGFWLGITFIIEPYTLIFGGLIFIAIFLYQKITIHTLLTSIISFFAPVILYFTYCFWNNTTELFLALFNFKMDFTVDFYLTSKYAWLLLGILIITLLSIIIKTPKVLRVNNTFRKSWILLIFHLCISISFFIISEDKSNVAIVFFLFPVAIIFANGLELIKNNILKNSILYILLFSFLFCDFFL